MSELLSSLLDAKTLIILLLVIQQTREVLANKDYKESQHEGRRESYRKGYESSQEGTRKTVEHIAELWRIHDEKMQESVARFNERLDELERIAYRSSADPGTSVSWQGDWSAGDLSEYGDSGGGASGIDQGHHYGGHANELVSGDEHTGSSQD